MPKISARDGSTWHNEDGYRGYDKAWRNDNGDYVLLKVEDSTTERVTGSLWVGSGGANRRVVGDIVVEYPDGAEVEYDSKKEAIDLARQWMDSYPDENGEYGD